MSESRLKLTAYFVSPDTAEEVDKILNAASAAISEARQAGEEFFLHQYLAREGLDKGISFDSWWIVEHVSIREFYWLTVELLGSPSGTEEQDFITWLHTFGVRIQKGEMVLDGGSDVEVVDVRDPPAPRISKDDLNSRDGAGHTQLHLAAEAGKEKAVRDLILRGADTEALNKAERTPIFMAINTDIKVGNAILCIDALLEGGANVNARSKDGETPLRVAKDYKLKTIVAHLKGHGAK